MSGQHPRLGEASLLVDLDELLLRQICDLSETRSLEVILHTPHPGGNPGANLKSISHRCYLFEVEFV